MRKLAIVLALCLSAIAQAQDVITLEDTGGFISKLVYDWTSDGSGNATGRTSVVVPGILFGVATTPDGTNVPTDNYDVVVKQAFTNTSGGVTVLAADITAGAVGNRDDTLTEWTDFWPDSILTTGGFIQIEISNAGASKEGRVEFYVYRTLAIIPEGGNGVPIGGATTQILQHASNGVAKWVTVSGDATLADGGNLQLVDPLLIEGLTMTGILTTGSAPTTVTNADGTIKLSAIEAGGDLAGTANQVILDISGVDQLLGANLTLSLPQDIHTGANVTFANITGTGILTMGSAPTTLTNADGTLILSALSTGANLLGTANKLTVTGGTGVLIGGSNATLTLPNQLELGVDDTGFGQLTLFGSGTISGGILDMYNPGDNDTNVEFYRWTAEGDLALKDGGSTTLFSFDDVTGDANFVNSLGIGTTSPDFELEVYGDGSFAQTATSSYLESVAYSITDTHSGTLYLGHSLNATIGTQTETASGDRLGHIQFRGVDTGGNWENAARIMAVQNAAAGTRVPARLEFYLAPDSTTPATLRHTFEANGDYTVETGDIEVPLGEVHVGVVRGQTNTNNTLDLDVSLAAVTVKSDGNLNLSANADASGAGQIGFIVDTTTVGSFNAAGHLDLTPTTTHALILSNLTTTQRDALTPVVGMIIFNTTTGTFQGYDGAWANLPN